MIQATVVAVVIGLILTAWVTVRVKGKTVKAEWVAPLWGVGGCAVLMAGTLIWYAANLRIYDQCIDAAISTTGARQSFENLYDAVSDLGHEGAQFAETLRIKLDRDLPRADITRCQHP